MKDKNGELIRIGATIVARGHRVTIEGITEVAYGRHEDSSPVVLYNPDEIEVVANPVRLAAANDNQKVVVVDGAGYGHVVPA